MPLGRKIFACRQAPLHYKDKRRARGYRLHRPVKPFSAVPSSVTAFAWRRRLDKNGFIRSMATRGNLGGLSRSTVDAVSILDAAGYARSSSNGRRLAKQVEIVKTADVSVVVLVPGMGDDIQAIKAGIWRSVTFS